MKKKLRSGFTTGACAAAAAKGAALYLFDRKNRPKEVSIPFPDGSYHSFTLHKVMADSVSNSCSASVIKDGGDDPDVTHKAEIAATVSIADNLPEGKRVHITGGEGVGRVTKPGLAAEVGGPAINPVPLRMIEMAVREVLDLQEDEESKVLVTISVPRGKELAEKTLNERLGIIGGISILGTTGIVRPLSAKAWTDTLISAMKVAKANGNDEIVLSTGRTSERAVSEKFNFEPEALVMMGDYLEFSLKESRNHGFKRLHLSGMWAKTLKAAMEIPQTHVRFGALGAEEAVNFIKKIVSDADLDYLKGVNTAREIYSRLTEHSDREVIHAVCLAAKQYHERVAGIPVTVYLVHHTGEIVCTV